MSINLFSSSAQVNRAVQLEQSRKLFLQDALSSVVESLDLALIDAELREFASAKELRYLASRGLRGEFVFAVPCIILVKPTLIAYYRMLIGYSQKEFYHKGGLGRFKSMEISGRLKPPYAAELPALCLALNVRAAELLNGIGIDKITAQLLDDLSLLTLGAQLRGGTNNVIGKLAIRFVFELIRTIVKSAIVEATETQLILMNAAKRRVVIKFSSDPDISIFEELENASQKLVAIEIKGGEDVSNIWNRFGEAEKSHQTAKKRGFTRFWTIYNTDRLDEERAREKTPTTQKFFCLKQMTSEVHPTFIEFKEMLVQVVGIPQ